MTELLINLFVKNPDSDSMDTRARYGLLGSMVGIIVNILLFSLKLTVGLLINSISVMADAFNNLSDTASSIITMFGFNLAQCLQMTTILRTWADRIFSDSSCPSWSFMWGSSSWFPPS